MRAQCDPTPRKGKIKLAFPDLSRFEFNAGNKYRINSSLWMDGLEFMAGRKEKGKDPVTDEGEVEKILRTNGEEFSLWMTP